MTNKKEPLNPWTPEDEREHYPSIMEWWCIETFFKSVENNKRWNLKASFAQWIEKTKISGSIYNMTLFDQDNDKHTKYLSKNETTKLKSSKDRFDVSYNDSFMKGSYPNYEFHFSDKQNNIKINIKYRAESLPHWIAQEITDGWLPMGLGFYRYGFIPKCDISGTMIMNDKTYTLEGKGYFEHVWGDFSYSSPLSNLLKIRKTISVYSKLIGWWLKNHKLKIPNSVMFSTENNPLGYDWVWALLDNEWTVYYGNMLFWIMKGPTTGTLILSKDGKNYREFGNVHFRYNKIQYSKKYDFYYPTELEVIGIHGEKKLQLKFKMTTEAREYVSRFTGGKHWLGFVICEALGSVEGYYYDGKKKTKLSGICKIEPQRQASVIGHNSLKIEFLKPPKGVGISFDLDSHYLGKNILTQIQLAPYPKIKWSLKRIDSSKIKKSLNIVSIFPKKN